MAERSRSFGPLVVLGVGAAALTAAASSQPLARVESEVRAVPTSAIPQAAGGELPLATTLSLVVLAAWGVVLVTRGRVRLAVSMLGAAAALGVLATAVSGWWLVPQPGGDGSELTAWFWLMLVAAFSSAVAAVLAVARVRTWPEMGTRYDTPSDASTGEPGGETSLDLWKAQDRGRDPTA